MIVCSKISSGQDKLNLNFLSEYHLKIAMDKLQKNTLDMTLEVLTEDLDVSPAIIHLISKGVFTEADREGINGKIKEKDKVMEFVKIIKKRGSGAYSIFYKYLKNCPGSKHLAEELEKNFKKLETKGTKQIDRWKGFEDQFHNFKCTHETISSYQGIPEKINILLIGKTGSGKSATGNMILGSPQFETGSGSQSVSKTIVRKHITEKEINFNVIDTPGLFETVKSDGNEISRNEGLMLEIAKTMIRFNTGIHLFLLVWGHMVRFTKEEQDTINVIEKTLGKDIYRNCVVIFTNARARFGGKGMESLKDYVTREIKTGGKFAEFLKKVKGNIIAVENRFDDDFLEERHREKFLCCLVQVIKGNKCSVYSNKLFEGVRKKVIKMQTKSAGNQISSYIQKNMVSILEGKSLDALTSLKEDIQQNKVPEEIKTKIWPHLSPELKKSLGDKAIETEIQKHLDSRLKLIDETLDEAKTCFAGSTNVSIKLRGNAKISNVKVGDEILVYDENGHLFYDKVYLLSHAIEDESITFIRLKTSSGKELFISPGHLLPAGNLCRNVSATDISIGDIIFTLQNSEMTSDTVTSITYELCRGAYCPMTMHGTIVVNDVAASCYTTFFPARLAHVLLSPIRFLFGYLPLHLFNGLFPYDAEKGMPILLLRCRNMITTWRSL